MAIILTKDLEGEIDELIIAHRKLGILPPIVAKLNLQIDDKEPIKLLSQSMVRNAYNLCSRNCGHVKDIGSAYSEGTTSFKNTSGLLITITSGVSVSSDSLSAGTTTGYRSSAGDDTRSITIGTSDAAESFESYNLDSTIAHGTGAGEVEYSACYIPDLSWDSDNKKFICTYTRRFLNNSGNTITVGEVGLIWLGSLSTFRLLVARDVLSPTIDLLDTQQLTVDYTLEFPYP